MTTAPATPLDLAQFEDHSGNPDWERDARSLLAECRRLQDERSELVAVLRRSIPWLGKMIADGAHKNSVAPLDCENALAQAEALLRKLGESA